MALSAVTPEFFLPSFSLLLLSCSFVSPLPSTFSPSLLFLYHSMSCENTAQMCPSVSQRTESAGNLILNLPVFTNVKNKRSSCFHCPPYHIVLQQLQLSNIQVFQFNSKYVRLVQKDASNIRLILHGQCFGLKSLFPLEMCAIQ